MAAAGGQESYFLHHVEDHMVRDEPLFEDTTPEHDTFLFDSSNRRARVLTEQMWTGLNVPCSDQEEEGAECCEVAITDTIQMRMQIKEKKKPYEQRAYIGGVVGDKLSPKHVKSLDPGADGYEYFEILESESVTTKLEFDQKERTNILKGQISYEMSGCSSHKIESCTLIMGDYTSNEDAGLHAQFDIIQNHLMHDGPLFGSFRDYGANAQLLGDEGRLYNMVPGNDPLSNPDLHAVAIVGWGMCVYDDGSHDVYWIVQNTWGEISSTKYGRATSDMLYYAVDVVV